MNDIFTNLFIDSQVKICIIYLFLSYLHILLVIFLLFNINIAMEEKEFINDIDNERADAACARLSGKSRSYILSLFEDNLILINNKPAKKSTKLKSGDIIHITFKEEPQIDLTPKNIPFDIIYDNENFAVINKPAGLTVHPAPGNYDNTLVNALLYTFTIEDDNDEFRPGIVHRLDKDTSGLMIIAKNSAYKMLLSDIFLNRNITKKYLAICHGTPKFMEKTIEAPIGRDKYNRQKMAVRDDGRYAKSFFKVIEKYKNAFLAEVTIFTGRTHQIRVHAASINHPLVGDTLYGGRALYGFSRQALHSYFLEFTPPKSDEVLSLSLQLPKDMVALQENLLSEK